MLTLDIDKSFLDLIEETYDLWGQPMPDVELEEGEPIHLDIEIEKTRIVLSHLPASDPEHFTMYCTLGPLPNPPAAAMRRALEMNALGSQTQGAVMAINPHGSDMLMILRVALTAVDPASLIVSMTMLARQAARWQKTYFLDDAAKPATPAPAGQARRG